jgi:hypothetical protein
MYSSVDRELRRLVLHCEAARYSRYQVDRRMVMICLKLMRLLQPFRLDRHQTGRRCCQSRLPFRFQNRRSSFRRVGMMIRLCPAGSHPTDSTGMISLYQRRLILSDIRTISITNPSSMDFAVHRRDHPIPTRRRVKRQERHQIGRYQTKSIRARSDH